MSDINNQICDAIGIIVDKKLSQANFDKTIQATIVAQGDKTKGEYKVKYLDSSFYAYDKSGKDYAVGTQVYVLVPENDLSKVKTILGTADKTKDIQPVIPEGNKFEYLTNNLFIISENEFGIKSWENKNDPGTSIYNIGDNNNTNFKIDTDGLSYIEKEGFDYFILKCNVRTNLQKSQQSLGTYGIRVTISADLKENQQNNEIENTDSTNNNTENQKTQNLTLEFILDSTMMVGNPYSLVIPVEQIAGFNVANYTNIVIQDISLFSKNFTSLSDEEEGKENNIFFTDLSLQCANKISADNLNGNYLYISVPNGQYLSADENNKKDSVVLKAIFQSKGQIIDPTKYSGLTYYWFKKNPLVSVADKEGKYCKINGINTEGWECLNTYDEKDKIFKAGGDIYTVDKNSFLSNQQEYRCIALFDNLAYSKTKMVYNKNPQYFISLTSDSGTIFYNNNGEPTLTCSCRQADTDDETITLSNYHWYTTKIDGQRQYKYNEDNKEKSVYSISINQYPDKAIVDCAIVKPDTTFIGIGTLELLNLKSDTTMPYNLTINNGSQMFKYNTLGISPIHSSSTNSNVEPSQKEKSAVLQPLSFTLVNNKTGEEFTAGSSQKWILPPDNETMFDFSALKDKLQDYNKEGYEGYRVYEGETSLSFSIKSRYDYTKINNTILLEVVKENQTYKAKTNILFAKEGDNGTNGTDYVCQIVGIQGKENKEISFSEGIPYYYYNKGNGNKFYYNQKPINNQLKLKVFKNGENIEIDNSQITWSVLKSPFFKKEDGTYISTKEYPFILTVDNSGNIIEDEKYKSLLDTEKKDIANIIIIKAECSFKDVNNNKKLIYATLPIGIVLNNSDVENNYIKKQSGFYYVIYDADGTNPSYDNTDAGIFEIMPPLTAPKDKQYVYKWEPIGEQLYIQKIKEKDKDNNDIINSTKIKAIAKEPLVAENISNGISCKIYLIDKTNISYNKEGEIIVDGFSPIYQIIIPIHLYTNRFGHAAINGWDGNTVSIDTEGGVVLAPQIGAGDKDENNAFTGVLMGTSLLKDHDKSTTNTNVYKKETGLMGLSHGEKSFFLNSEDGSAVFGKNGSGQIKFIPADENGKPQAIITGGSYSEGNNGTGMEINLSAPSITYGNHKFMVNEDGILTCTDANINGWFSAKNTYDDGKKYEHYELKFSKNGSSIFMQNGTVTQQDNNSLKSENDILIKPGYFRVGSSSKLEPEENPENNLDEAYAEDKDTGIEINSESYFKYDNGKVTLKGDFFNSFEDKDNNGNILGSGQVSFSGKNGINMKYQTTKDNNDLSQSFCTFSLNHQSFLFEKRRKPTEEELKIINAPADGPIKEEKIPIDKEGNVIASGISYTQSGGLKIVGKLTATSGTIGGWRITDKYIASQNNEIILYSDGRIIGQYKNKYKDKEIGNDSDFSMMGSKSKVSFTNSGMSTFKYVPAPSSSSSPSRKTYQREWYEYTSDDLETLSPAVRQGDVGYWKWSGLNPYNDSDASYGEPYLITRFQTDAGQWIEIYARDKIGSWISFSSIGAKKAVIKENDDSTDVDQVSIEAQQPKTPICFSITSDGKLASSIMKFAEPLEKKPSEKTNAVSTFSSKASAATAESSKDPRYAELSFPYSETTTTKNKDDKDVKVTKEYDGTRISAVKIITGDVEIDENAKVQMKTRSAHSLVSAVNEMLTPPDQVQYIDGEANANGITIDKITETWKAKNGTPAFQFNYQVHIENKGKADESVKYLIREDKTEGEGENKKVILPGYTIELTGF